MCVRVCVPSTLVALSNDTILSEAPTVTLPLPPQDSVHASKVSNLAGPRPNSTDLQPGSRNSSGSISGVAVIVVIVVVVVIVVIAVIVVILVNRVVVTVVTVPRNGTQTPLITP
jgi:hypothetical protein